MTKAQVEKMLCGKKTYPEELGDQEYRVNPPHWIGEGTDIQERVGNIFMIRRQNSRVSAKVYQF